MSGNTLIQILRSYANVAPTTLSDGQPAYSFVGQKLYIGNTTGAIISIGGQHYTSIIDNATQLPTANTLVNRDLGGNAQFNMVTVNDTPFNGTDAVNFNYFNNTLGAASPSVPLSSNTIYFGTSGVSGYSNVHVSSNSVQVIANNKQVVTVNDQNVIFSDANVVITANLYVQGTTVISNVVNDLVDTNQIFLNGSLNQVTAPTLDAYYAVNRGSSANTSVRWHEASQTWQTTNDGTNYYDIVTVKGGQTVAGLTALNALNVTTLTQTNQFVSNNYVNSVSANIGDITIGKTNAYTIENQVSGENINVKTNTAAGGNINFQVATTGSINKVSGNSSANLSANDFAVTTANGIQFTASTNDIVITPGSGKQVKIGGVLQVTGNTLHNGNIVSENSTTPMYVQGYGTTYASLAFVPNAAQINVIGTVEPTNDASYNLGASTFRWQNLYLSGTGYIPTANVGTINANTANLTTVSAGTLSLVNALATSSGGTGLQTFTANGVFYAGSSSTTNFATGNPFQVMQLNSLGVPSFAGLDGGQF